METDFKVKIGTFEGPLDILLDLIEKRKLHISEVTLSAVAEDFLAHTKNFEDFPIADSADFILIASTLLLIKSKSLLPTLEITEEEKGSIEDLENRLTLHKKFKELSQNLRSLLKQPLYFAEERKKNFVVFSPTGEITILSLQESMASVLNNLPKIEILPKVIVRKVISLEEMIDKLSERIQKSISTSFKDFANTNKADKVTVIVGFLAILELVKRGAVRVNQNNSFDDITIESESVGIPRY